ncbi:MAG: hypothetical protein ACE5GS_09615, partial [Kiloniellaceae bacterium]
QITNEQRWKLEAEALLDEHSFSQDFIEAFHTTWTVAAHHIRSQIGDDRKLVKLLRQLLPKYDGPNIKLYRGENLERWREKQVGFCWTRSVETARMFGRRLNATGMGGVLLVCQCSAASIIAGPSKHSEYLGEEEFTVDPFRIERIVVAETYPSSE